MDRLKPLPLTFAILSLVTCFALIQACTTTTAPSVSTHTSTSAAPLSSAQLIYQQYGPRLESSARIANILLEAAGEAHGNHLITDAQLEQVRALGHSAESALNLAKAALKLYIATGDANAGRDLSTRMMDYDRILLQLQEIMKSGGAI